MRKVPPVTVLPPDVVEPSSTPAAEKKTGGKKVGLATGETPGNATPAEEVSDKKDTLAPVSPPNWDEMMEMLKRVSCFTDSEAPSTKMSRKSLQTESRP